MATVAVRAVLAGGFEVSGRLGAERAMAELRARLVDQLLRRRPGGLRDARTGELAAAAVQGIDSLEAYFARYLPQLVLAALAPPAIVVYLAFHDPVAAAVLAVTIPLIPVFMILADVDALQHLYLRGLGPPLIAVVVGAAAVVAAALVLPAAALVLGIGLLLAGIGVPALVGALVRRAARRQAPARAALTADLVEVIDGAPELAALGREDDGAGRVAAAGDRLARLQRRDALAAGAAAAAGTLLANGAAVAVAAVGSSRSGTERSTASCSPRSSSSRSARSRRSRRCPTPRAISAPAPRPPSAWPRSRRRPPPCATPPSRGPWRRATSRSRTCACATSPEPCGCSTGRRCAWRPADGSRSPARAARGKTTIARLLVRFLDPEEGRVTLGGADLRELAQRDVRRVVRLADQDAYLFTATIAHNVRLARPEATDAEVEAALAEAGLGEWIGSLPDGIATPVGRGGSQVSGGQRQRIALARVLLSRAPTSSSTSPRPTWIPPAAGPSSSTWRRCPAIARCYVITHELGGLDRFDEVRWLREGRLAAM